MSPVNAPAKVLVSGVNGYLGVWVARKLLEADYSVRGTVRSVAKSGDHLNNLFASYGDKWELVEVPDITVSGAFDESVKGVDVVAHTASPFHFNVNDPSELIDPAVKGTVSILESIKKTGQTVKRVVLTSSVAAVNDQPEQPTVYDESRWNDMLVNRVKEKGAAAGGNAIYKASKTLAERAAWDFVEKNQSEINFDLTAINPPNIYGPPIHEVTKAENLNTSQRRMYDVLTGAQDAKTLASVTGSAVDVRDVAKAHVLAISNPNVAGERTVICEGTYWNQDFLDIAHTIEPKPWDGIAKGVPGQTKDKPSPVTFDTSKFERLYGFELNPLSTMIKDSLEDFKERGWVEAATA
ncbi:NAD-P-binding protein [Amylostereum chailletii]|nr:NAD-P-binding protein [Amylostereum chailletii]